MKNVSRDITWVSKNPAIGTQEFEVSVRGIENVDDAIQICGSLDRAWDILNRTLLNYANPTKAKFEKAETLEAALLIIADVKEKGASADLVGRGEGTAAKVKELDKLKEVMSNPNASREDKLAALAAMGYAI